MIIYLSLSGIILSIILLAFNGSKFRSTIYLGLFFLVVSLYGVNQYAILYSKSVTLIAIIVSSWADWVVGFPILFPRDPLWVAPYS
jgi:hypothetical protein